MSYRVAASAGRITLNEPDRVKSVLQNVSCILRTWQTNVPMFREFGLPMGFIDKPMPAASMALIVEVREAIRKYEPRADVLSVRFSQDNAGVLTPEVEVSIRGEESGI